MTLYNDNDPRACAWLRELIAAGELSEGVVDGRSVLEIEPRDIEWHDRCHFFAGIGGWDLALQLAGWPADRPVWTASLPCQPFSDAGKKLADRDERHLWPAFRELVAECRPATLVGEQVASRAGLEWLAGVRADLESIGYAVGAVDLPAACVGAPHRRQRLFWCARRLEDARRDDVRRGAAPGKSRGSRASVAGPGDPRGLADACVARRQGSGQADEAGASESLRADRCLADADERGQQVQRRAQQQRTSDPQRDEPDRCSNPWSNAVLIPCADGRARRIEPGLAPLAHGVPGRVGLLRGYGNAIVAPLAAKFIEAVMEIR